MAKGSKREGGGIGELLAYAGDRKFLTYLGMALSALSQLLSFGPYVCIWLVARDLSTCLSCRLATLTRTPPVSCVVL